MVCGENMRFCGQFIQRKGKPVGFPCFIYVAFSPSKPAPDVPVCADGAIFGGSADFYPAHYRFLLLYAIFYGIIET